LRDSAKSGFTNGSGKASAVVVLGQIQKTDMLPLYFYRAKFSLKNGRKA